MSGSPQDCRCPGIHQDKGRLPQKTLSYTCGYGVHSSKVAGQFIWSKNKAPQGIVLLQQVFKLAEVDLR